MVLEITVAAYGSDAGAAAGAGVAAVAGAATGARRRTEEDPSAAEALQESHGVSPVAFLIVTCS